MSGGTFMMATIGSELYNAIDLINLKSFILTIPNGLYFSRKELVFEVADFGYQPTIETLTKFMGNEANEFKIKYEYICSEYYRKQYSFK